MREEFVNFLINLETALFHSLGATVSFLCDSFSYIDQCTDFSIEIGDDYFSFHFNDHASITIDFCEIQDMVKTNDDYSIITDKGVLTFSS